MQLTTRSDRLNDERRWEEEYLGGEDDWYALPKEEELKAAADAARKAAQRKVGGWVGVWGWGGGLAEGQLCCVGVHGVWGAFGGVWGWETGGKGVHWLGASLHAEPAPQATPSPAVITPLAFTLCLSLPAPACPLLPLPQFVPRPIRHPLFKNTSMQEAAASLTGDASLPVGQALFRPSMRSTSILCLTIKLPDTIWHLDLEEQGKVGGWGGGWRVAGGGGGCTTVHVHVIWNDLQTATALSDTLCLPTTCCPSAPRQLAHALATRPRPTPPRRTACRPRAA